jgi:hypothetical protein
VRLNWHTWYLEVKELKLFTAIYTITVHPCSLSIG